MFKYIGRMQMLTASCQSQAAALSFFRQSQYLFATNNVIVEPNKNKYQESQMLFFADPAPEKKKSIVKPRTIQEIKKLQSFVQQYKTTPGKSLNE